MKLFKRTAKDADGVTASAQLTSAPADAKAAKNSPNALLPGVLAALYCHRALHLQLQSW